MNPILQVCLHWLTREQYYNTTITTTTTTAADTKQNTFYALFNINSSSFQLAISSM